MNLTWINLPGHRDERGSLVFAETESDIPFAIKRVYYLFGNQAVARRGFHAHRELRQVLVAVAGRCTLLLDDGGSQVELELCDPARGLLLEGMVWREIHHFTQDCVLLCLASTAYDENDYIRNYESFIRETRKSA